MGELVGDPPPLEMEEWRRLEQERETLRCSAHKLLFTVELDPVKLRSPAGSGLKLKLARRAEQLLQVEPDRLSSFMEEPPGIPLPLSAIVLQKVNSGTPDSRCLTNGSQMPNVSRKASRNLRDISWYKIGLIVAER